MKAVNVPNFKTGITSNLKIKPETTKIMSKKTKAFLYNFIGFALFYTISYFIIITFTHMTGLWVPITSAVVSTIIAPKFQVARFQGEEKIFMKWLFVKGIKEVK